MTAEQLNADFSKRAICDTKSLEWQQSPAPGIWRKRLELSGLAESGRVTSLVRFDPGTEFPEHGHPEGEEILVLDGTFSDEHGDFPKGTFVLNSDGTRHTPYSKDGCLPLVKLRQYPGPERRHVRVDTLSAPWQQGEYPGRSQLMLYDDDAYPEAICLFRLAPGCEVAEHPHPGGEELFVLEGGLEDQCGRYEEGCWSRSPAGSHHWAKSESGCLLYVRLGHLS